MSNAPQPGSSLSVDLDAVTAELREFDPEDRAFAAQGGVRLLRIGILLAAELRTLRARVGELEAHVAMLRAGLNKVMDCAHTALNIMPDGSLVEDEEGSGNAR